MSSDPTDSAPVVIDPYDVNAVLAISAEAVCWGFYTCLFITCMFLLYSIKNRTRITVLLTAVTIALYALSTTHFAIYANQTAGVLWTSGIVGAGYANSLTVAGDTVAALTCFLGDLTLIYRLWLFYGTYKWRYIIVGLLCTIDVTALAIILYCNAASLQFLAGTFPIDIDTTVRLLVAYNALLLATNALISILIFGRAMYIWKQMTWAPSLGPRASRALIVILESGLVYLMTQIVVIVFHQQESTATTIAYGCAAQVYGIVPTFITAGIAYGLLAENSQERKQSTNIGTLTVPSFGATESTAFTDFQQKVLQSENSPDTFLTSHKAYDSPV